MARGEAAGPAASGWQGHEQRGRRYAVVLQPDWLNLSTLIVAFTSTSARETSFRPPVTVAGRPTLVMRDQIGTVDLDRFTEPVGFVTVEQLHRIDQAITLVLDL